MDTKLLDESAKDVYNALVKPIQTLQKDFEEKLKGVYKRIETRGWFQMSDLHRIYLINEFPGTCFVESNDEKRFFLAKILFDWNKFDKYSPGKRTKEFIEFDFTDKESGKPNSFKKIPIKVLKNKLFIQSLRDWLNDGTSIPWEKWVK